MSTPIFIKEVLEILQDKHISVAGRNINAYLFIIHGQLPF